MKRLTKYQKEVLSKYDFKKEYVLDKAVSIVKEISKSKFDASFDLAMRLGVDPRKSDQMIRGTVTLPNGTGKKITVLALCPPNQEEEAKSAGADFVGYEEYIKKIESGWTNVDVIVTTPSVMAKVGKLGKILGPRGLMPNPKSGTVSNDIGKAVKSIKSGRIEFKVDKYGIVHASVGLVSFSDKAIKENLLEIVNTIKKLKPNSSKGNYIKSISISSTMSKGVFIEQSSLLG